MVIFFFFPHKSVTELKTKETKDASSYRMLIYKKQRVCSDGISHRNSVLKSRRITGQMDGWPAVRAARDTKFSYMQSEKEHFHEMEMEAICI